MAGQLPLPGMGVPAYGSVIQAASAILLDDSEKHNTEETRAEDSSRIAQLITGRMTIRNDMTGIIAENGSDICSSDRATITDNGTDIVLIFG